MIAVNAHILQALIQIG